MAKSLLNQRDRTDSIPEQEACWQGAVELALRSRQLLMVMIARLYQDKQGEPHNLESLKTLLGDDIPEVSELESMALGAGNWWAYFDQLQRYQTRPPSPKKTVSDENIIAVAADYGPERSSEALNRALADMKNFTDVLEERHSEW
ncbi:DUF6586 family protein [Marinobacter sp. CHS3-4]|uniref:DUF6586 family protein n=1 Tax=Marinobacter sp. CHS3-4 TaxID=3045174 RepID=UPI0024B4B16E|nr:DUF6586 family protein [Marinobacter sp. CHS3-4]MDI9245923.1 hypothetical protein [Marinobacter sp. CHS3-4]